MFSITLLLTSFLNPGLITAISAILINAETGAILYEKNPHELRSPASIVKIATCAYAIEKRGDQLDVVIETPQDCIGAVSESEKVRLKYSQPAHWLVKDASHIGMKRGELFSFKDLLYGMMVASADDASNVIAHFVGDGSITNFMIDLNQWMKNLGCTNTTFLNPHGLYHPKQRTTAYDMSLIAKEAMKNSLFRELVKTTKYPRPKTNKQESTMLVQTNHLLRKGKWYYPYATGIKTGKIEHSGFGLVSSAEKDGRSLIAVVLGCKERSDTFKESIQLFEAAFNEVKENKILFEKGVQVYTKEIPGTGKVTTMLNSDIVIPYYKSEEPILTAMLSWNEFSPPLLKGERIGTITIHDENKQIVKEVPLLVYDIEEKSYINQLLDNAHSMTWKILGGSILLILLIGFAYRFTR